MRLVFRGECQPGHHPVAVREAVAMALHLDDRRTAQLFSGRKVVLRRAVDEATAMRYIARFAMLGAVLYAEPSRHAPPDRPAAPVRPAPAALPWRQGLRWAGIGALTVLGGASLGLLLGPGLTGWLQPGAADGAALPPPQPMPVLATVLPAMVPAEAPASAPAGEIAPGVPLPPEMTDAALRAYRLGYAAAAGHKAFALSSRGVHAWHAGAATDDAAREAALGGCMAALQAEGDSCRVVDADGQWQD
ncbi:hypothetical protein ACPOLB_19965 [Rubrivivax sp. RP6-9]|uniref:hypothetical protein n=1 Tax=Rubrivivax sp. RP6-9 TaxID=3415750 RepID=UPI003CC6734F